MDIEPITGWPKTQYFKFHLRRINLSNTCGIARLSVTSWNVTESNFKKVEKAELRRTHFILGESSRNFSVANLSDFRYREESCCREHLSAGYCWLLLISLFRESFHKGTEKMRGTDWFAEPETLSSNLETSFSAQSFWFLMKAAEPSFPLME